MKLEIDLDMSQIDYEAINKQIQDKIAAVDLKTEYSIGAKIDSQIGEMTAREVNYYFRNGAWSDLNDRSTSEIKGEIAENVRRLVKPHVEKVFSQIPQEELNKIIAELLPKVLLDIISSNMRDSLSVYYYSAQDTLSRICEDKIRDILGR